MVFKIFCAFFSFQLNGKQKAYVINQSNLAVLSGPELAELDKELEQKAAELKTTVGRIKAEEAVVRELLAMPTDEEVVKIIIFFYFFSCLLFKADS